MKITRRGAGKPRVEMLPLIDIVFLLLIFFIYAMLSMAVHQGLDLDLPESSTARITQDKKLSISVKRRGADLKKVLVLINETPVELEHLSQELRLLRSGKETEQALIFAEEKISYQELFQVLDQVKLGGISRISLQADRKKE